SDWNAYIYSKSLRVGVTGGAGFQALFCHFKPGATLLAKCSAAPRRLALAAPRSGLRGNGEAQLSLDVREGALGLTRAPQSSPCSHAQPCTEVQHTCPG